MFISPCIWFSPLRHLARWGIWSARTSGPLGHLARWGVWPVGASGPLGRLARWGVWPVGASGPLERLARWDVWSVSKCLALVEHLAVKGRLVRYSNTSGPKGHPRQRELGLSDELYKGRMPNFLSEAKPDDKLRFDEVQEQDIRENDWLRLYTDFALYCYWQYNEVAFKSCLPAEINKILVETFETHRDPSLKVKSSNAIFHINFTAKSCDYISVVRRTTDGRTGHIILEISTWTNPPSSA
ncbi:BnaC08g46650D [Brassica napus]|uniref:BnaC08g46650D protein n=1 Tax=Brassica napus TaxID=3708 RepID=A0A078JAT3_BRANA|nr:BnaC08g46650D [Brassica napus]